MSWKGHFDQGVKAFRSSNLEDALDHFTKAIEAGGNHYSLYDSRAAVLEKLGRTKDALRDAKATIDAGPSQWQGYARSSRLFFKLQKYTAAVTMADLALERLKEGDQKRAEDLRLIKGNAGAAQAALAREKKKQHAATFYHFGKLPVEIIGTIFSLSVEEDSARVIVLSHVCQHWRDISLKTPTLWSTLVLSRKRPGKKAMLWDARSAGMVKDLSIRKDFSDTDLAPNLPRWSFLRSFRTSSSLLGFHHILHPLNAREQEHLLRNIQEIACEAGDPSSLSSHPMPALRRLEVRSISFDWNAFSVQVSSLRELIAYDCPLFMDGVLSCLRANPMLETLSFAGGLTEHMLMGIRQDDDVIPLALPHLRSLELAHCSVWSDFLISMISLPCLETLTLTALRGRQDPSLQKLIHDGVQHLTEFRMQKCSVSPSTILKLLRAADALETLEVSHIGGDATARMGGDINDIVEALAAQPPAGSTPLCPSLQHLNVSHCPAIKTGPLVRLVKSRLTDGQSATTAVDSEQVENSVRRVKPLQSLVMDGCPLIEAEALPWLRSKVPLVSCVYMTKKAAQYKR